MDGRLRRLHMEWGLIASPDTARSASADQGLDRKLGELLSHLMLDFLTLLTQRQHLQAWTPTSQVDLLVLHQRQNPGILKVGAGRKDQMPVVVSIKDVPHDVQRPVGTGRAGHHLVEKSSGWLHRHRWFSSSIEGAGAAPQLHPWGCRTVRRFFTRSFLTERGAGGTGLVGRRRRHGITGHGLIAES